MIKKLTISILLSIVLLNSCSNTFGASGFDFARIEAAGNREPVIIPDPSRSEPSREPEEPKPEEPIVEEDPSIVISVPTRIEGIVYEDCETYENIESEGLAGTKHITNNYKKDDGESLISGVEILDGNNLLGITSGDGSFSFSGSGNYNLKFKYGKNLNENDYELNKNTLKYNGQDYTMVMTENSTTGLELNYLRRIKEIEKSYTEVYVLIDYSLTMREDVVGGTSRLDIVKSSAINFVNSLFANAEGNLAVGFIAFSYEAVVLKKPTEVCEDVVSAIENFEVQEGVGMYSGKVAPNFSSLNHRVGTNLGGAVLKAKQSYLSDKSNKVMVLFSDGAATAHNNVESIYEDDTNSEISIKLDSIASFTRQDLKSIISEEIRLISILNKTEDLEKEYVNKSFKDDSGNWIGTYYEVDYWNEEAVKEALLNDVKKEIEDSESEFLNYKIEKDFSGNDDIERRKEVNENYNELYYGKLQMFNIIDELTGEEDNDINVVSECLYPENTYLKSEKIDIYTKWIKSYDDPKIVEKFIENSWMQTEEKGVNLYQINSDGGKISSITCGSDVAYTFSYYERDGEEYCAVNGCEYKAGNVAVNETTIQMNGILIKRDPFKLELEQKITGVRLTLSDGTVLYNKISSNAIETLNNNNILKEAYCKQLQKQNGFIDEIDTTVNKAVVIEEVNEYIPESATLVMDTDILHGATLEVEYTMIIKNNSQNASFTNEISIIDYFDNGLIYRADGELLSEDGKNSDYGWKTLKIEDLYDKDSINKKGQYISEFANQKASGYCLYANFTETGYKNAENITEDGIVSDYTTRSKYINPVIGNNGQRYVKVVLSKVLSVEALNKFNYKNQAEILKYSNNNFRRSNWQEEKDGEIKILNSISGNYVPCLSNIELHSSLTNIGEIDTAIANPVQIIPPTGMNKNVIIQKYITILTMLLIPIMIIDIKIKNKVKVKK